ncbi:Pyridoxal phosphate-dependent decarboxylase [Klebsormidium nitens]|uniref:Pyridoxal phosphate-dependent decarboxylase n=1 Tax=Klebsormidium nitens TaxID=105231 RepID=A0A1Y1IAS6_KLENI|nr:Pyridoxal phosphate-dependent decarboxylase [Klebsormidium nitens]|eukprot:GAQ87062.1 Pyridoxal phosphate-dependent decarboxylase [Klebsormidium nitens]
MQLDQKRKPRTSQRTAQLESKDVLLEPGKTVERGSGYEHVKLESFGLFESRASVRNIRGDAVSEGPILPSEYCQQRLDALYERVSACREEFIGYPLNLDFDYSEVLAPFLRFSLNNVGDPYQRVPTNLSALQTHDFEREVLEIFCGLTGGSPADVSGYVTNGGTEGNMYGLYLAREVLPRGIVYFSDACHYSVFKILRVLQMRSVRIRTDGRGEMDYNHLRETLQANRDLPAIVFANIGSTMTGAIDSLPRIKAAVSEAATCRSYIHCDAALSGFVLPFAPNPQPFGFSDGADSISVSGHKLIGSPIPCGVVLARRCHVEGIGSNIEYVGALDTTLSGSRNGLTPLVLWYAFRSRGIRTVRDMVRRALDVAAYATEQLRAAGVDAWRHENSLIVVFPRPSECLVKRWHLAAQADIAHLVTMPHVSRNQG